MFKTVGRAIAIAALGFGIAGSAQAGQVEKAYELYASVNKACLYTADLIEQKNIQLAKTALPQLKSLTAQMLELGQEIQSDAKEMAPPLGDSWATTVTVLDELDGVVEAAAGLIGRGPVDFKELRDECAAGNTAVANAMSASQVFGRAYWKIMTGTVENANGLFDDCITESTEQLVAMLAPGVENTDGAYDVADDLHECTTAFRALSNTTLNDSTAISRPLADLWQPVDATTKDLDLEAGLLEGDVGNRDYRSDLALLQNYYANTNAALVRAYKAFQEFGTDLTAFCDSCR